MVVLAVIGSVAKWSPGGSPRLPYLGARADLRKWGPVSPSGPGAPSPQPPSPPPAPNVGLWILDLRRRRIVPDRLAGSVPSLPHICIMVRGHLVRGAELVTLRTRLLFVWLGPLRHASNLCGPLSLCNLQYVVSLGPPEGATTHHKRALMIPCPWMEWR